MVKITRRKYVNYIPHQGRLPGRSSRQPPLRRNLTDRRLPTVRDCGTRHSTGKFVFSHALVMSSMDRTGAGKKTPEGAGHTRRYCTERAENGCRCAMKAWRCSMCDARPRNSPKSNDPCVHVCVLGSCALLAQRKRRPSPVSSLQSMSRPLRPCLRDWSVRFRVQSRYIICTTDEPRRTVDYYRDHPLSVLE